MWQVYCPLSSSFKLVKAKSLLCSPWFAQWIRNEESQHSATYLEWSMESCILLLPGDDGCGSRLEITREIEIRPKEHCLVEAVVQARAIVNF